MRVRFASLVSGWYFFKRRRRVAAWFLSIVALNWLMAGGILRRNNIIFFIRCNRMYFGHFTKRVRSRFGWMVPPMLKFFGVVSTNGCFFTFFFSLRKGAPAVFFPALTFAAFPMAAGATPKSPRFLAL